MFLVSNLLALKALKKSSRYIGSSLGKILSQKTVTVFSIYLPAMNGKELQNRILFLASLFFQHENYLSLSDMKILKTPFGILVISCFIASSIKFLLFISLDLTVHLIRNFNHINKNPLFVIVP